jgi:multicomponent Na+:H+ antiporter subunit D
MQMVLMSFALIATGMGIKIAVFPLHGWLPDAHSMAPSPVSALLSGVTVKIGIYCLIRVVYTVFSTEIFLLIGSHNILMVLGVVSLLFGARNRAGAHRCTISCFEPYYNEEHSILLCRHNDC